MRIIIIINKKELSIETPIELSPIFGASIHATLRRYVEHSKYRCALIVLKDPCQRQAILRNLFRSDIFFNTFGNIKLNDRLDLSSGSFIRDYIQKKSKTEDYCYLETDNGRILFKYQFFYNHYNGWERFSETYFSEETMRTINAVSKLTSALQHRPFNPESESYKKFLSTTYSQMKNFSEKNPNIDFSEELKRLER